MCVCVLSSHVFLTGVAIMLHYIIIHAHFRVCVCVCVACFLLLLLLVMG